MNHDDQMPRRPEWPRNPGHAIEFGALAEIAVLRRKHLLAFEDRDGNCTGSRRPTPWNPGRLGSRCARRAPTVKVLPVKPILGASMRPDDKTMRGAVAPRFRVRGTASRTSGEAPLTAEERGVPCRPGNRSPSMPPPAPAERAGRLTRERVFDVVKAAAAVSLAPFSLYSAIFGVFQDMVQKGTHPRPRPADGVSRELPPARRGFRPLAPDRRSGGQAGRNGPAGGRLDAGRYARSLRRRNNRGHNAPVPYTAWNDDFRVISHIRALSHAKAG